MCGAYPAHPLPSDMNASQFFIEYLIVGAFAVVTVAFAVGEAFGLSVGVGRELSTGETALLALLLPTVGLAIDCIGKVMLWGVDAAGRLVNAAGVALVRYPGKRLGRWPRVVQVLRVIEQAAHDPRKPTISHAQMGRLGAEVVRQSEMRKSRERVSRGAFASAVICTYIFSLAPENGPDRREHLAFAIVAALIFCGAWYRYRRRVRVYREKVTEAFADVLALAESEK
ncbi:MAG: hypothetical protein JWO97_1998 [Acidobacteria bacterium]|nr:hypothetical protein [Acidobacteriota bacterium]